MGVLKLLAPITLQAEHELGDFESGVVVLDDWLKRRAHTNQIGGASRTYVAANELGVVIGYYAISTGTLSIADAPGKLHRNMPDPIPMTVIGRLAVDRSEQGKGLGVALLQDAVLRIRQAAAIMGIRGIMVHAISNEAKQFYEQHGFVADAKHPMTLLMSIADQI